MIDLKTYYAVIFTSTQSEEIEGYAEMSEKMESLAKQQKGFLGFDSARNDTSTSLSNHIGITVSYWENLEAIKTWKANSAHLLAQQKGRKQWYDWYNVKICKVEHEYEFEK
ncbi:antibiotic biosynthesis monooxygenase family protein [Winogradskyella ursingii]|uniref:antibiotic biosynthesis monooxygenase family protein n=1 Tax=Winogradskyella ursingii TaxID=2686079 RepID=UPI0015C8F5BA|nr:antibiotic biosynthesis monooxygenase [Winogradskyella ursingii]